MTLSWIANTSQGRMVGDYISTSVRNGANAFPTIAVAFAPSGGTFNEAMHVPTGGLQVAGGARRAVTGPMLAPSSAGRLAAAGPGAARSAR
jgi:hypothetical protein